MAHLKEVPTEDLLSFGDFPTVHAAGQNFENSTTAIPIENIDVAGNIIPQTTHVNSPMSGNSPKKNMPEMVGDGTVDNQSEESSTQKSFWTLKYYQKYFDVDTGDVVERILASVTPKWDNSLKHHLRTKPDLYGPFWISVTLIFTIAISGNIANYFQFSSEKYHWKYDFHLVSYAATTICLYVTLIPGTLWSILKYTTEVVDIEGLEDIITPGVLELICIYGYSLFIYIPVSILWSIQISWLQWLLVLIAAFVSGSVLLLTLMPALRLSKHKFFLSLGIVFCHLTLAAGFMLYFFHVPSTTPIVTTPIPSVAPPTVVKELVHKSVNLVKNVTGAPK